MEGSVSSFLPGKGYGFVLGDDKRSYFLHQSDLVNASDVPVEGQRLTFDESATPKGYRARRVRLVHGAGKPGFQVPDAILHSRQGQINGWETIEATRWSATGSSRESPDQARSRLLANARRTGANAVVLVQYFKTRGSESGTGGGTHHFTIHNFRGYLVTVGRPSMSGTVKREDLEGLATRAGALKKLLEAESAKSRRRATRAALVVAAAGVAFALFMPDIPRVISCLITLMAAVITRLSLARDHDGWLQHS